MNRKQGKHAAKTSQILNDKPMCNAMEELVPYVFGWPAILTALVLAVAGAASRKIPLLLVGAIVLMPFSIYLGETPRFEVVGFLMPLLFLGSAYALKLGLRWVAWSLLLLYIGIRGGSPR